MKKFFNVTKDLSREFKECFVSNCLEATFSQIVNEKFGCVTLQSLVENWGFSEIQECFIKKIKEKIKSILSNRYSSLFIKQIFISELSHKVS